MRKMFQKSSWRFPKSTKEEAEFGRGKKDILICRECEAFYWHKSWHHDLADYAELSEDKNLRFTICPACRMIKDGRYEGEVIIENMPEQKREEIENLITNFGETAFERDPMDRIISIQTVAKGMLRILTTENQMAQQLAKKIKKTFKGKVSFLHSKRESTLRAKIVLG
jgi:NMD protein affecting ribosome stability and mRNA decay